MYSIEELFDKRAVVGAKLARALSDRGYTKAKFCAVSGISRPTLDKLLTGNLSSKTNYQKHMAKALKGLALTPDALMGNTHIMNNRSGILRNALALRAQELAMATGLSLPRLMDIEAGAQAELSELRDIAFALSTGVSSVLGVNYFETQLALMDDFIHRDRIADADNIHGFWGHIGLQAAAGEKYLWFPITAATRHSIYRTMDNDRLVVPCMNNKLLYVNTEHINNMILLDEACDAPAAADWDPEVSCGQIPLVIYEAMEDYLERMDAGQDVPAQALSTGLAGNIRRLIQAGAINAEEIAASQSELIIHYSDGSTAHSDIIFQEDETITDEISAVYEFESPIGNDKFLYYTDGNEAECFVNTHNVAVMELPLFQVESAIRRKQEQPPEAPEE